MSWTGKVKSCRCNEWRDRTGPAPRDQILFRYLMTYDDGGLRRVAPTVRCDNDALDF